MNKKLLFLLTVFISLNHYAQTTFEKGYYIDNADKKIECLIKNIDWKSNPTEFEFKHSESSEPQTATINSVEQFSIYNIFKYIRKTVNMDRSNKNINYLSKDQHPLLNEETLFLKVLVEGRANLYEYVDGNLKRYFYSKENSKIEQLIFKHYKTVDNKIGKNNRFRNQLWNALKCPDLKLNTFENLNYKKNDLVKLFTKYHECNNSAFNKFEPKQNKVFFNFTLRPRLNNSSLKIQSDLSFIRDIEFENKTGLGFGLEAELILPYNNNKWAIAIEPTYQSYKSKKESKINNVSEGTLIAEVNYTSIEIPLSLRHYLFLNKKSKMFINASFIFDLNLNTSVKFTGDTASAGGISELIINSQNNFALGVGYKQKERYSLELRYQTGREIITNASFNSSYKTLSLIFGYTLFK